jgi:hypothetical protein
MTSPTEPSSLVRESGTTVLSLQHPILLKLPRHSILLFQTYVPRACPSYVGSPSFIWGSDPGKSVTVKTTRDGFIRDLYHLDISSHSMRYKYGHILSDNGDGITAV